MTQRDGGAGGLAALLEGLYAIPARIPGLVHPALRAGGHRPPLLHFGSRQGGRLHGHRQYGLPFFEHEFGLPMPVIAAHLAALAENILPILLVLGFATRLSALALFVMTIVIQFVYPGGFWNHHILWFFLLLFIMARGPGCISLDHLIAKKYQG